MRCPTMRRRTDRLSVSGAGPPAQPSMRRIRACRLERRTDCPSYDDGYELIGWKTDRLSVLRGDGYEVHRRGRTDRLSGSAVSGGCGLRRAGRPSYENVLAPLRIRKITPVLAYHYPQENRVSRSAILALAAFIYSLLISYPIHFLPRFLAATQVVPTPQKGSRTRSSSNV